MKKFFSLLVLCLLSLSMWGDEVVTFETAPGYYPAVIPLTFRSGYVTLSVYGSVSPPGFSFSSYGSSSISTSRGVITSIEFEQASSSPFTFSTGSIDDFGNSALWVGSASEVVFVAGTRTGKIIVTLDGADAVSCGIGEYADHYDEMIVSPYDAVVLAQYNSYLYLKDETGYGLVFGNVGQTYKKGDVIPVGFSGKVISYDCHPELQQPTGFQPAIGTVELEAEEITATQIDEAHWAHYVVMRGVTYDPVSQVFRDRNGNEIPLYNRFNVTFPEGVPFDIYGIVGAYRPCPNTIYQFIPTEVPLIIDDPTQVTMVCTYQNGNYLYGVIQEVKASSGWESGDQVLVYGNVGGTFTNGDVIRGHYQVVEYGGFPQIQPRDDWEKIGESGRIYPETVSIEDVSDDMIYNYLSFKDVTLTLDDDDARKMTIEDETGSLPMFNKFNVGITRPWQPLVVEELNVGTIVALIDRILTGNANFNPPDTYDVTGFLSSYGRDHTLELNPTYIQANPRVWNDDINGDGEVNLADVNALINIILYPDY